MNPTSKQLSSAVALACCYICNKSGPLAQHVVTVVAKHHLSPVVIGIGLCHEL